MHGLWQTFATTKICRDTFYYADCHTVDDAHAFIKYAKDCQKSGGEQCFAITLDDNVIGCISYTIQSSGGREYFKLKLLVSEFFSTAKNREDGLYRPLCFWCPA